MAKKPAAAASTPQIETMATQSAAPPDPVEYAERVTRADLASALEMRRQLRVEAAAGVERMKELATIGREIEGHRRKLSELDEIKALRTAHNSAEAKQARFQARIASLQFAIDEGRSIGAQAQDVLKLVNELGAKLSAIAVARASIQNRISDVIHATGEAEHVVEGELRMLQSALNAATAPDQVHRALFEIGIGVVGIELPITVRPPAKDFGKEPATQAVERAVQKLKDISNAALGQLKAKEAA